MKTETEILFDQLVTTFNQQWDLDICLRKGNVNTLLPRVDLDSRTVLVGQHLETLLLLFNFFMVDQRKVSPSIQHFLLYHLAIRKNMYAKAEEMLVLLDQDVDKIRKVIDADRVPFYLLLSSYQTVFLLVHEFSHIHYYIDREALANNLPEMKDHLIWLRKELDSSKLLILRVAHVLIPRLKQMQTHSFDEAIADTDLQEELLCDNAAWKLTAHLIKVNIPDQELQAVLSAFVIFTLYYTEMLRTLENIYMTTDNDLRMQHLMFDTTRSTVLVNTAWDDVDDSAIQLYKKLVNSIARSGRLHLMVAARSNIDNIGYLRNMPKETYSVREVKRLDKIMGEVEMKLKE